jgi:hypothetical protein
MFRENASESETPAKAETPAKVGRTQGRDGLVDRRARRFGERNQVTLQETVGHVQLPFVWIVTPQLLPLPFGFATSTCELG